MRNALMPSFDIVCEVDLHEVTNAVDQANREVETRFDFKGSNAKFTLSKDKIELQAEQDFQLKQMIEVLKTKLAKRKVDLAHLEFEKPEIQLKTAKQAVTIKQGIEQSYAKEIIKRIKDSKLKVQATIQGEQVRVTGKNRDDLQDAIALLRQNEDGLPLQFVNFRD